MNFIGTFIEGLWLIRPEPHTDHRGSFERTYCQLEFAAHGLTTDFVQHSMSRSHRQHTLRGMHFQRAPHAETKLVTCSSGALWDVVVDLRPNSATRGHWFGVELSAENGLQLYIPPGLAHGFLTLQDNTTTRYMISAFHTPDFAAGIRFDDPEINIPWPAAPECISSKDLAWPTLSALAEF